MASLTPRAVEEITREYLTVAGGHRPLPLSFALVLPVLLVVPTMLVPSTESVLLTYPINHMSGGIGGNLF